MTELKSKPWYELATDHTRIPKTCTIAQSENAPPSATRAQSIWNVKSAPAAQQETVAARRKQGGVVRVHLVLGSR